jgi:hypothetical protein
MPENESKDEMVGDPKPIADGPKHLSSGDTLSLIGLGVDVILFALVPSVATRGLCLIVGIGICTFLAYKAHFVRNWPPRKRHFVAASVVIVLLGVGGLELLPQWKQEHANAISRGVETESQPALQAQKDPPVSVANTPHRKVHSLPAAGTIHGTDNTLVGNIPNRQITGNGNTIVGATDANGNTILNRGGTAIGIGAKADPTSIAIGAHAGAGVVAQPTYEQKCEGSACAQGPGSQATYNQYGAPKMVMTVTQRRAVSDAMKPYAGIEVSFYLETATDSTLAFAQQLCTALRDAGMNAHSMTTPDCEPPFQSGMMVMGAPPPGISVQTSKANLPAIQALAQVFMNEHLLKGPLPAEIGGSNDHNIQVSIRPYE